MARVGSVWMGILFLAPSLAYAQTTGGVRVPTGGVRVPTSSVHVPYPPSAGSMTGGTIGSPGVVFPPSRPGGWPGYGPGYYRPPVSIHYNPPIYVGFDGYGYSSWSPPLIVASPTIAPFGPYPYPNYSPVYAPTNNYYVQAPQQPQAAAAAAAAQARALASRVPARPSAKSVAKGKEYIERGDRFFQSNKNALAKERYQSALKNDPTSSDAIARLATMALVKGDRAEALSLIHEAVAANPNWLANPANIQAMFAEPAEFHKLLGDLEADVQAHPDDREGWMLLGVELYLSGRVDRAKDVFLRLNDRKPDPTLAAFLSAVKK